MKCAPSCNLAVEEEEEKDDEAGVGFLFSLEGTCVFFCSLLLIVVLLELLLMGGGNFFLRSAACTILFFLRASFMLTLAFCARSGERARRGDDDRLFLLL